MEEVLKGDSYCIISLRLHSKFKINSKYLGQNRIETEEGSTAMESNI